MSEKVSDEELIDDIIDNFQTYLMKGFKFDSFTKKVDPNLNINNLEKLLRIHFVLTEQDGSSPGVIGFVKRLPQRLRRMKTSVRKTNQVLEGEIKGRVDWQETIKRRAKRNNKCNTIFTCTRSDKDFQIKENLILKELIAIIHDIVFKELKPKLEKGEDYGWLKEWTDEEGRNLKKLIDEVYLNNIYLQRVERKNEKITSRMINDVKKSRSKLYREAAILLEKYRKLINFEMNRTEVKKLLKNTFIRPEKREVLFELYWSFKILDSFEGVTYHLIERDSNIIAKWNDEDYLYEMHHNSKGSSSIEFLIKLEDIRKHVQKMEEDDYLFRIGKVTKEWGEMARFIFSIDPNENIWSGKPDIIIERYNKYSQELNKIFIGEVKDTNDKNYAISGLKQLMEYMSLVKKSSNKEYLESQKNLLAGENVKGALFINEIEGLKSTNHPAIDVVKFSNYEKRSKIDKSKIF